MARRSSKAHCGTPQDKFSPNKIIEALKASAGINLRAARMLRCSPSTIANYVDRYPEIAEAKSEIEAEILSIAETVLLKHMKSDERPALQLSAAKYYLRTRGRSRGYGGVNATNIEDLLDFSKLTPGEANILRILLKKAQKTRIGPS